MMKRINFPQVHSTRDKDWVKYRQYGGRQRSSQRQGVRTHGLKPMHQGSNKYEKKICGINIQLHFFRVPSHTYALLQPKQHILAPTI